LETYFRPVRSLPRVSREEERKLWKLNRHADPDARNRLALAYIGLVVKVARRFYENGLERDDMRQEGFFGLLDAIDSWNPEERSSFATHAWYHVRKRILHAIDWTGHTIRPRSGPPIPTISIFTPLHDDEGDLCLADQLVDKVPGLDDMAEEDNTASILDKVLRSLPKREEIVLRRHTGSASRSALWRRSDRSLAFPGSTSTRSRRRLLLGFGAGRRSVLWCPADERAPLSPRLAYLGHPRP
jgi:RNA polymerase sigma factor (sigma-70 family)